MASHVLDPRSIVEALACLQLDMHAEDITHPASCRVQAIYHAFCTQILEVPEKSLSQLPFECQFCPETAEIQNRSTPLLLLFTTMRCFVTDFGEPDMDFTMCDLINPNPKRTRKLFSLLADYTNFYRAASQVFEKTSGEYDSARKSIEDGQEQIRLAELRKSSLRSEQDARRRKENALLAEFNTKNNILTELIKDANANEEERDALLNMIKDSKEQRENLFLEMKSLQGEIEHLRKGLVHSPERVRGEAGTQREQIKLLEENCAAERSRIDNNNESMSIIEQASKVLSERFDELEKLKDLEVQLSLLEQDASSAKAVLASAIRSRQQIADESSRLAASSEEEVKKYERARDLYSSRLTDLKKKKEELINSLKSLKERDPGVRGEVAQIKTEMQRVGRERVDETQHARTQCMELVNRFADLMLKYQRSETLFEDESVGFSNMIRSVNEAVDDAERLLED